MQGRDRDIELVPAGVLQGHQLGLDAADLQDLEPEEAPHPVLLMDHRGPGVQLGEVAHHRLAVALFGTTAALLTHTLAVELRLAHQGQTLGLQDQPLFQGADGQGQGLVAGEKGVPAVQGAGTQPEAAQMVRQQLPATCALRQEEDAPAWGVEEALQGRGGLGGPGLDGQRGRRAGAEVHRRSKALVPTRQLRRLVDHPGHGLDGGRQLVGVEIDPARRQQGALDVVAALLVAGGHGIQEARGRLPHPIGLAHQGPVRQVIEQGRRLLEEQRQVILQPPGGPALGDLAVDQAALGVALDLGAVPLAEGAHRLVRERKFPRREQAHLLDLLPGTLGIRVEGADGLDLVVEEVDAQGLQAPHGEDVQQGPADRELPMGYDL